MNTALFHLTTLAALAVLIVLCFGLYTMLKGDTPNLSQKVMRWRVGLQFIAIMLIASYVYMSR